MLAAITSNPGLPSGASVAEGFSAPAASEAASSDAIAADSTAAAAPSKGRKLVAVRTADGNSATATRRTFSIDDGGIRLPAGVKAQE